MHIIITITPVTWGITIEHHSSTIHLAEPVQHIHKKFKMQFVLPNKNIHLYVIISNTQNTANFQKHKTTHLLQNLSLISITTASDKTTTLLKYKQNVSEKVKK